MFISNCIFRSAPGTQAQVLEDSQDYKRLWEKHGANECHLFTIQGGDMGCMSFIAQFDSAEAFGKTNDSIAVDPEFQALVAKTASLGGQWVRHNLARAVF